MRLALQACYIFTAAGPPLRDASLTIDGGQIVAVGAPDGPLKDLGRVALLPGLVNAHTHLEFSHLDAPLGKPGVSFVEWIRQVVAWRRGQSESGPDADSRRARAVMQGLAESDRCGVKAIGEIATPPFLPGPFESRPLDGVAFLELLGLAPQRREPLLALAREHTRAGPGIGTGISPHAPYTVGPELLEGVVRLSREVQFPLAMHLAETAEELELLQSHSGPFAELLRELDAWHPSALPRGLQPGDYLRMLADAHRALIIHGNYLTQQEICFLGEHRRTMSVVYCPRTHAYFGHERYPLSQMLAAGVTVAVGTDSRASNPDLDLFEELRWIARHHPEVAAEDVLRMGRSSGARALGCDDRLGTLETGKQAEFVIVSLPQHDCDDPYELLFDSSAQIQPPPHGLT